MSRINKVIFICAPAIISIGICILSPFVGINLFSVHDVIHSEEVAFIFWNIRVPRMLTAFFAGGGLAVAGVVFQALFRNPLAGPYTLGISGGASFGAAICIYLGISGTVAGIPSVSFFAFSGAIASALLIYIIAWSNENKSMTLILAGVVISTMFSGMIMFIHQISSLHNAFVIMRWTMGGVDASSYSQFFNMLVPLVISLCVIGYLLPQLDHFLTGDDIASSRGIDVKTCRTLLLFFTALLVGSIVAVCGPISFVGIIAPHTCRMIVVGVRHRFLAYSSFFVGGAFLTSCDTVARTLTAPIEIPVGIITALLGGPFFLMILIRNKRKLLL